jgi:uncharacterized protein (DUF4415 family)
MKTKKSAESSRRERLTTWSEEDMRTYAKSPEAKKAARRMRVRGTEPTAADLKEIPLFGGIGSAAFRPVKQSVTVRIDHDVVSWLRAKPGHYQTNLNAELRKAMQREQRRKLSAG